MHISCTQEIWCVGHISYTHDRWNAFCENLGHVYVSDISCTFPAHFQHVSYTSKMYHIYNAKYTQIEANIPSLYKVNKVYK